MSQSLKRHAEGIELFDFVLDFDKGEGGYHVIDDCCIHKNFDPNPIDSGHEDWLQRPGARYVDSPQALALLGNSITT
jgi:hypothetical protein